MKAFADNKINLTEKSIFVFGRMESNMGKGENAGYRHFLLFAQCFQKLSFSWLLEVRIVCKELKVFTTILANLLYLFDTDRISTFLQGYGELDPLEGLKNWLKPRKEWMNFAVRHFSPFLPPESLYNAVGEVYYITEERLDMFNFIGGDLSSNRYFPPHVDDGNVGIHRMLSMFHAHPFIINRFGPRGAVGIIRAKNEKYLDIVFRFAIHISSSVVSFSDVSPSFKKISIADRDYLLISKHIENFFTSEKIKTHFEIDCKI